MRWPTPTAPFDGDAVSRPLWRQPVVRRRKRYFLPPGVLALWLAVVVLAGCTAPEPPPQTPEPPAPLVRVPPDDWPVFSDDLGYDGLAHGLLQSLAYLRRLPPDRAIPFGNDTYDAAHLIRSIEDFAALVETGPSIEQLQRHLSERYRVYRSPGRGPSATVLFTGYYEPFLRGSRTRSDVYRYPVYGKPDDLLAIDLSLFSSRFGGERIIARYDNDRVLPYYDRKAISEEGILDGKADILAWVTDRVDLFFLQIQGSGRIFLDTGEVMAVHYHASNGRPYRSIGKLLIDEGKIAREEMSMQRIRDYLNAHPGEISRILTHNPSYVFFREDIGNPTGSIGVTLTPGRSVATDRRIFPPGALAFIVTEQPLVSPDNRITGWAPLRRFALNQDTGGAIRGPGRADLYWGSGPYAELAAGNMQHPGRLYFLVLDPRSR